MSSISRLIFLPFFFLERSWIPPWPFRIGLPHTALLSLWPSLVCSCNSSFHNSREKSHDGVEGFNPGRETSDDRSEVRWTDGWMGGWIYGWMDGWMDLWMDGWMDGWIYGWMDGFMDVWMDGWMDGWNEMNDWIGRWVNEWHRWNREQRVTGFCIHLLIGLSTLLTVVLRVNQINHLKQLLKQTSLQHILSVLKLIPMPVLYGVFLYMGITSLTGVQFIERITILFMPVKYQPDYIFLRHVKTVRVHAFTLIQLVCFVLMWIVKQIKVTSIAFPLMVGCLEHCDNIINDSSTNSNFH